MSAKKKQERVLTNLEAFDVLMEEGRNAIPNRKQMQGDAVNRLAMRSAVVSYIDMKFANEQFVEVKDKDGNTSVELRNEE